MRGPRYAVEVHVQERERLAMLAADVRRGLAQRPRWLPPKWFYDPRGSALFARITRLPEYYLTRVELSVIDAIAAPLVRDLAPCEIVEIGAGAPLKIRRLLDASTSSVCYLPVDVDAEAIEAAARALTRAYPQLEVHGVVGDFERDLAHVPPPRGRRLAAFFGSTIGNLDAPARHRLLLRIRRLLGPGDRFLLGVDLVKDRRVLERAYDDRAGVTAEFNRNILRVVNRGLDGDFRPEAFRHHAWYNEQAARIEMHLVAASAQTVRLRRLEMVIELAAGESIWTESSYKFTRASTLAMLKRAGFELTAWYTDRRARFALALAAPTAATS